MQIEYPGITGRDVRYMLEGKYTKNMEEIAFRKFLQEWGEIFYVVSVRVRVGKLVVKEGGSKWSVQE